MSAPHSTPADREETDVLIVGAGPVGLTLANTLGLAGVRAIVVEKLEVLNQRDECVMACEHLLLVKRAQM